MVRVITVERQYGSEGAAFAHHLAETLGWRLVDNSLITEVARKAGVEPRLAEHYDERVDPWFHRLEKAIWLDSLDKTGVTDKTAAFDSARMVTFVRDYLQECASQGDCVVVGRGAACVLAGTSDALHVFVYAPMAQRIQWLLRHFPDRAKEAEHEIRATDRRRAEYVHRFHHHEWSDPEIYTLMLNSLMGFEAMTRAVLAAANLKTGREVAR